MFLEPDEATGTEYIAGKLIELVLRKFHNERSTNSVQLHT